jgi:hypothetical protein
MFLSRVFINSTCPALWSTFAIRPFLILLICRFATTAAFYVANLVGGSGSQRARARSGSQMLPS